MTLLLMRVNTEQAVVHNKLQHRLKPPADVVLNSIKTHMWVRPTSLAVPGLDRVQREGDIWSLSAVAELQGVLLERGLLATWLCAVTTLLSEGVLWTLRETCRLTLKQEWMCDCDIYDKHR